MCDSQKNLPSVFGLQILSLKGAQLACVSVFRMLPLKPGTFNIYDSWAIQEST